MKLNLTLIIGLSFFLKFAYSQKPVKNDCEEFKKQNINLIIEKKELSKKLDNLEIGYDKLTEDYREAIRQRDKYRNLYYKEKGINDSMITVLKNNTERIRSITEERDRLRGQIASLEKLGLKRTEDYKNALLKIDELNTGLNKAKNEEAEIKRQWDEQSGAVGIIREKLKKIEDELNDYISVKNEIVYFKNTSFKYESEILFIPYNGNKIDEKMLDDSLQYSLKRLIKLISKYDFRVKVKLIGESNDEESKKTRKELALGRAENLQSFLCVTYNLSSVSFSSISRESDISRTGVSIQIVRK